jgi:hypothetical protein
MFIKKEKYLKLQYRIKELKEKLCPYEQHEYVKVSSNYNYDVYIPIIISVKSAVKLQLN